MDLKLKRKIDLYAGSFLIVVSKILLLTVGRIIQPLRDQKPVPRGDILVQKFLGGGSLVIAFPALLGLKRRYPQHKLLLVTTPGVRPFAELLHLFDDIHTVDDSSFTALLRSSFSTLSRCFRADTVFDLEAHSRLSCIFSILTFARIRVGFYLVDTFWKKGALTHLIYFNRCSPVYRFYEKMVQFFDAVPATPGEASLHLLQNLPPVPGTIPSDAACIGHACSDLAHERMLTPEQWVEVIADRKRKLTCPEILLFLGSSADSERADLIIKAISEQFSEIKCENLCGRLNLAESVALIRRNQIFWGIDSGLLHLARLTGAEITCFFGPTDPSILLQQIGGGREEIHYEKIPCSPCVHNTEVPPCCGNNICIQNLFLQEGKKKDWIGWIEKEP